MKLSKYFTRRATVRAVVAAVTALTAQHAFAAAPLASGTIAETASGVLNTYSLTLNDGTTSSTPIGSIWAAWIPGQFYLTSSPSSIVSPTGWTANLTSGTGGYGIQWIASSSAFDVPAGGSLSGFSFQTPDQPSSVFGNSVVFPTTPTMTSVAYEAGLFSDGGTKFVFTPTAVPEPASLALIAAPVALLARRRAR